MAKKKAKVDPILDKYTKTKKLPEIKSDFVFLVIRLVVAFAIGITFGFLYGLLIYIFMSLSMGQFSIINNQKIIIQKLEDIKKESDE